jgi:hypothetical protein
MKVQCIDNTDYPASLEKNAIYEAICDNEYAERLGLIRVFDESGDGYLYNKKMFTIVEQ